MSQSEDRYLEFVLKHYKTGKFDTQKAIVRFMEANGMKRRSRHFSHIVWSMSAAAVLLVGVFLFMQRGKGWTELTAGSVLQTFILPDSTCVTLAPGASVSYREKDSRKVRMEGKIFFDVTPDAGNPFEIRAEGAFIRVLGTEFMVDAPQNQDDDKVRVYVSEGKVLFAKSSEDEGVVLTQGMGAVLGKGAEMPVVEETADINSIAWQRGSFIFDHTPLEDVLKCLSSYYGVSFIVSDLSKELTGEFRNEDLDLIIDLIESALDVTIVKR